jgi:hypothetical protein
MAKAVVVNTAPAAKDFTFTKMKLTQRATTMPTAMTPNNFTLANYQPSSKGQKVVI